MQEIIRVLCVFSTLGRGGAESMCMNLYRKIDRNKIQFDFVKHTKDVGAFEDEIVAMGGRIFEAPRFNGYNIIPYILWWEKHFKDHPEHHIIHGHYFTISSVYFAVAHKYNRVTVGHVHASRVEGPFRQWVISLIENKADYCLACSEQAGKWVYPHRKYYVLANAIDTMQYQFNIMVREQYRNKLALSDKIVFGTVANFSTVKNPFGLLNIFKVIHDTHMKAVLLWVGDGDLRNEIEAEIEEKNLNGSVLLLGTRNDVACLLQAMDCFMLPSFSEGLPVSVIEAQAAGLPCLISDSISKEVDISGLCKFLSIEDINEWVSAASLLDNERIDTSKFIRRAGYDIHSTTKWVQQFYFKINSMRRG